MNIKLQNISHSYQDDKKTIRIFENMSLDIPKNKITMILGPSGCGKTTLINILGGLLRPQSGEVYFDDISYYKIAKKHQDEFRANNISFVFQMYHLIPDLTAIENVLLSMHMVKASKQEKIIIANKLLDQVGMLEYAQRKPFNFSGGEQQRIAVARALANDASIVIADEPTGNLDTENGDSIIEILCSLKEKQKTIIIVTHNENYIKYADNTINLGERRCD
ncbi:MAG: ABC transporter ATP-binding protein [Clostridiales bacterium]|nr:ABC transporter ATP-binding protein [Clostridiales bacterium]